MGPCERIELLLNTLRGERHCRRSLLAEVRERLASSCGQGEALDMTDALIQTLETTSEAEYERLLARVEELTRATLGAGRDALRP